MAITMIKRNPVPKKSYDLRLLEEISEKHNLHILVGDAALLAHTKIAEIGDETRDFCLLTADLWALSSWIQQGHRNIMIPFHAKAGHVGMIIALNISSVEELFGSVSRASDEPIEMEANGKGDSSESESDEVDRLFDNAP